MNQKHLVQILLSWLLLLPLSLYLHTEKSRAEGVPPPSRAPTEQLVFIESIGQGRTPSLLVYPALLEKTPAASSGFYRPDTSKPPASYVLSPTAQIILDPCGAQSQIACIAPCDFAAACQTLSASGASPLFFIIVRENTVHRLEYAPSVMGPIG